MIPSAEKKPWHSSHGASSARKYMQGSDPSGGFVDRPGYAQFRQAMGSEFTARMLPTRSSYVSGLCECPRKFLFSTRFGLRRRGVAMKACDRGKFFHYLCEKANTMSDPLAVLTEGAKHCEAVLEDAKQHLDDQMLFPDGSPWEKYESETSRGFSEAQMMFQLGYPRFFQSPLLTEQEWTVLMVEEPIEIRYHGIPGKIRCKPDSLLVRKVDGALAIVNYKTTSKPTGLIAQVFNMATQAKIEHLCVRTAFPKSPTIYYLHNIAKSCTLKFPTKTSPTWEDYLRNCAEWYEKEAIKDPANPPFLQSFRLMPNEPMDRELHTRLYETAKALRSKLTDPGRYYRDDSACLGKFGNSLCTFFALCHEDPGNWAETAKKIYERGFREDAEDAGTEDLH